MNSENPPISKDEQKWIDEAESDLPVEEITTSMSEEKYSKLKSYSRKIMSELESINVFVLSFLAFLIAIFLTVITISEESFLLALVTIASYLVGFIYAFELFKRLRSKK